MTNPPAERAEAAITDLIDTYRSAVTAIRAVTDRQRAFELATKLGEAVSEVLRKETAQLRAEFASDIYKAESLSLAGLAQRIGVSRARAQDLVEAARTAPPTEEGDQK